MKAILIGLVLASAVATPAAAQYTEYTPRTKDEAALVRLEDQWCDAAIKRDRARLGAVFADDLIYLTDTESMTKAQAIDDSTECLRQTSGAVGLGVNLDFGAAGGHSNVQASAVVL